MAFNSVLGSTFVGVATEDVKPTNARAPVTAAASEIPNLHEKKKPPKPVPLPVVHCAVVEKLPAKPAAVATET
jgi:hypothetical protein